MALLGVSGSDATNYGWNTAVGFGVFAGCAVAAFVVKKIAAAAFARVNERPSTLEEKKHALYSKSIGAIAGLVAAVAAYKFIPGLRCALIIDPLTGKMLKIGTVEAAVGFVIDCFVSNRYTSAPVATIVGLGGALATRFGYPVLGALGAVGAGFGAGFIPRGGDSLETTNMTSRFRHQ